MRLVLVHGFNVRDGGANTVDRLAPYFVRRGHQVDIDDADYGYFGLWAVRFRKRSAVVRILGALEKADVVISHSNGSNYANKAAKLLSHREGREIREVRLSPALNRSTACARRVKVCYVFHTLNDFWTWAAGFLPWHPWGRQGWRGYQGQDPRLINFDYSDLVRGHSDWFSEDNLERVAQDILDHLEEPHDENRTQ